MHLLRPLLVTCMALCAASGQGADNQAQSKAREVLEQRLRELQAQTPDGSAPSAVSPPSGRQPRGDTEAIGKAREAVRHELQADQSLTPNSKPKTSPIRPRPASTPSGSTSTTKAAGQSASAVAPGESGPPANGTTPGVVLKQAPLPATQLAPEAGVEPERLAPPGSDAAGTTKFIESMRRKMQEPPSQLPSEPVTLAPLPPEEQRKPATKPETFSSPAPEIATGPMVTPPARQGASSPEPTKRTKLAAEPEPKQASGRKPLVGKLPAFLPLEGPALPMSQAKQQRLAELLVKYQADEISPAAYHDERAKILSQP